MQYKIVATDKDGFTRIVAYTYNENEVVALVNEWRGRGFEEVGARHEMGWLLRVGGEAGDITVRYEVISELGTSEFDTMSEAVDEMDEVVDKVSVSSRVVIKQLISKDGAVSEFVVDSIIRG